VRFAEWLVFIAIIIMLCILFCGCASYEPKVGGGFEATGFMRTLSVYEEFDENGNVKKRMVSTQSNSAEILAIVNELIDTTVDTVGKVKP